MAMDPFIGAVVSKTTEIASGGASGGSKLSPEESPFKAMMEQMGSGEDLATSLGIHEQDLIPGGEKFQTLSAEGIELRPEHMEFDEVNRNSTELVIDMLQEVNRGQLKMDHFMNEILYGGRRLSNQELLAVQARIYHFAQLTELTVKVAQEGVSSTRTLLNTQVQ